MLNLLVLAQATTSPDEKLVGSFNAFVSAINTIATVAGVVVALLSLVVGFGLPIWVGNFVRGLQRQTEERVSGSISQAQRDIDRAIGTIEQSVQEQVRLQVQMLRRRTGVLEKLLSRETTINETTVDYFVPESLAGQPEGLQILDARGFRTDLITDLPEKFGGDIVVLDLTHSRVLDGLVLKVNEDNEGNQRVAVLIRQVTAQITQANTVLVVYVRGQCPSIWEESKRRSGFASANFLIPFVGTVVNSAYVVSALKQRRSN